MRRACLEGWSRVPCRFAPTNLLVVPALTRFLFVPVIPIIPFGAKFRTSVEIVRKGLSTTLVLVVCFSEVIVFRETTGQKRERDKCKRHSLPRLQHLLRQMHARLASMYIACRMTEQRSAASPRLKGFGESTAVGARLHKSPYPEPEGRMIGGGEARDGHGHGHGLVGLQRLVMRRPQYYSPFIMR